EESGNTVEKDLKFKNQNWRLDTLEKQVKLLFARLNHNLLIVKAQRDEIKNSEEVASEIHKLMEFFAEKNNNLLDRIATLEKRFTEGPKGFAASSVASNSVLRGELDAIKAELRNKYSKLEKMVEILKSSVQVLVAAEDAKKS